jgi:hypothetical protein
MTCIPVVADDIPYNGGGNRSIFRFACKKNSFYRFIKRAVCVGDSFLIFEIAYVPDTAQYELGAQLFAEIDG